MKLEEVANLGVHAENHADKAVYTIALQRAQASCGIMLSLEQGRWLPSRQHNDVCLLAVQEEWLGVAEWNQGLRNLYVVNKGEYYSSKSDVPYALYLPVGAVVCFTKFVGEVVAGNGERIHTSPHPELDKLVSRISEEDVLDPTFRYKLGVSSRKFDR